MIRCPNDIRLSIYDRGGMPVNQPDESGELLDLLAAVWRDHPDVFLTEIIGRLDTGVDVAQYRHTKLWWESPTLGDWETCDVDKLTYLHLAGMPFAGWQLDGTSVRDRTEPFLPLQAIVGRLWPPAGGQNLAGFITGASLTAADIVAPIIRRVEGDESNVLHRCVYIAHADGHILTDAALAAMLRVAAAHPELPLEQVATRWFTDAGTTDAYA